MGNDAYPATLYRAGTSHVLSDQSASVGRCAPLGATVLATGVNFSIYSRDATLVELLLFDSNDDAQAADVVTLDPWANRTYHYWHTFVPGLRSGQVYGYRFHGPFEPETGMRFDPTKVLL